MYKAESCLREAYNSARVAKKQRVHILHIHVASADGNILKYFLHILHIHVASAYGNCTDMHMLGIWRLINVLVRHVPELACSSDYSRM